MIPKIQKKISEHQKWISDQFQKIAKKEYTPHDVALGFSLGVFVALATPGFDVLVALLLTLLLKNLNKLAVVIGVVIINPITTALIYPFIFKLGAVLIGYEPLQGANFFSLHNLLNISKPLLVGNIAMGIILGVASYPLVYAFYYYTHYRKVERKRAELMKKQ
ncbi:DUF2062 domain-containing protein [Candidatus Woesearchaeota archaeon]|nr:DUF2062 domain-containing protein [Candidatus Woesearchaeota archaeon]